MSHKMVDLLKGIGRLGSRSELYYLTCEIVESFYCSPAIFSKLIVFVVIADIKVRVSVSAIMFFLPFMCQVFEMNSEVSFFA